MGTSGFISTLGVITRQFAFVFLPSSSPPGCTVESEEPDLLDCHSPTRVLRPRNDEPTCAASVSRLQEVGGEERRRWDDASDEITSGCFSPPEMLAVELLHITGLFFFPSATFLIFPPPLFPISAERAAAGSFPARTNADCHVPTRFFLFPVICGSGEGSRHAATFQNAL